MKDDIPDWAYAKVMEWDQWKAGLWSEFLKRKVASERLTSTSSFTERRAIGQEFNQEAKEIADRVDLEFTSRLLDDHKKDEPGMYSMAYIQIEAVRESRWMNTRPMNMSPLISMMSNNDLRLVEELRVLSSTGKTVPTILKKLETEAEVKSFMSIPEFRVGANMELNHLTKYLNEYLMDEDPKNLEVNGRVGNDSNVVVMTIASST